MGYHKGNNFKFEVLFKRPICETEYTLLRLSSSVSSREERVRPSRSGSRNRNRSRSGSGSRSSSRS